jgi:hypothetical protein
VPSPREVALTKNDPAMFADVESAYNAEEGCPRSIAPQPRHDVDVRAHAAPSPEPAAPCRNLRRDK